MDIQLTKKTSRTPWYLSAVVALLVLVAVYFTQSESSPTVASQDVTLLTVEQGELELFSQAFGELFSAEERMLTSQASGKVSAIYVRPGALVEPDTVILSLANPELTQAYHGALGDYKSSEAELGSFELEQQNARLDYQGRIADIEAALERAKLELSVNTQLTERGVSAKLELQRAKLSVKQEAKRLDFEKQKYQHFLKVQAFQLKQRQIALEQQQQEVALLQKQLDDMSVKAGIHGTLQSLEVELGQSLPQGAELGRVGSDKKLLARLRVPQHQADQITLGAPVELSTRKGHIAGQISRIESLVTNGVVLAEVALTSELPTDARPLAPVTGQIYLQTVTDALYVEQTAGLRPLSQLERFVLPDSNPSTATKRQIQLGDLSKGKILIQSGLQANEQLISQMHDAWAPHSTINIEQQG
ncbi:HlyD family efflux transporter periplasmic adaptor subunit [Alteromonas sediminis]|uniref:HlyD family efflux transporter periplasmic adaptor subunit n=1 Tax=Alteromonas sediminis TaxID=2259342 RepID=A0A3N5Y071_9ALTE|nr:HlyD family efflux transporter periplasmic adaptor subunit [Alteromonas sediminis]RPJ65826.1 HlyD family efflux transporter periplasmic adaptor subunit [Alteromonas sediminis]